jgi:peroxiredoxin
VNDLQTINLILLWVVVLFNLLLTLALIRRINPEGLSATTSPYQPIGLEPGEMAPPFSAETLSGETVTLSHYANQRFMLIFTSPTCGPCRDALPGYETAYSTAAKAGVNMVLVSTGDLSSTRDLINEYRVNSIPVLVAPRGDNPLADDYKVSGTPSFCLVNQQGKIERIGLSSQGSDEWRALLGSWQPRKGSAANVAGYEGGA